MQYRVIVVAGLISLLALNPCARAADAPATNAPAAPAAPVADTPQAKAWAKIKADFETLHSATSEDQAKKAMAGLVGETKDFFTKYPDDLHAINATMLWAQLGQEMNMHQWAGGPPQAEVDKTFDTLATGDKLPRPQRAEIRAMQLSQSLQAALTGNDPAAFDESEKRFDIFAKEFGPDYSFDGQGAVIPMLRGQELQALSQAPDTTRYDALVKKLAASSDPQLQQLAAQAKEKQQRAAEIKSKPLDIKFTAVDGSAVDLAKLRGKVVLVDFWATWSPPCREEVPHVVAAYQKYHAKGFEVVGISLDQDKDALTAFIKEHGMAWPQYFDGKGWDNEISSKYGIDAIPAMWLLDKKGMLVTADASDDLDGQVGKLLAAP
jgi:thiol-disulfide isomerase/thioredoxin